MGDGESRGMIRASGERRAIWGRKGGRTRLAPGALTPGPPRRPPGELQEGRRSRAVRGRYGRNRLARLDQEVAEPEGAARILPEVLAIVGDLRRRIGEGEAAEGKDVGRHRHAPPHQ